MHIVVCIKQIIDPELAPSEFRIDFQARKAVEDQGKRVLNPYDGNALEVALQLKDRHEGTTVTVMTMGAESDQKILRHALAMGCDDAIWLRDDSFDNLDSQGMSGILIYTSIINRSVSMPTKEALGMARAIARKTGDSVTAALVGAEVSDLAQELITCGADQVCICEHVKLSEFCANLYLKALEAIVEKVAPRIVLIPGEATGTDIAPRLAQRIKGGLVTDCIEYEVSGGGADVVTKSLLLDAMTEIEPGTAKCLSQCWKVCQDRSKRASAGRDNHVYRSGRSAGYHLRTDT